MALFGIRYYCFSLQVIKGQHIPLSSSYSGSTVPLSLLPFLTSCQLHLISYFGFPDCIPKADLKSSHSVSWEIQSPSFPPMCSSFRFKIHPLILHSSTVAASGWRGVPYYIYFLQKDFLLRGLIVTCQPK